MAAATFLSTAMTSPAAACILPQIYFFAHGSAAIDQESEDALKVVASWLHRRGDGVKEIRVTGHSDLTGSRAARRAISLARAEAVKGRLVSYGVPASLIVIAAMGDAKPVVPTADGVPEPDNRRADIGIRLTEAGLAALRARPATPIGSIADCS
jgi:outer membrane protein OmpA-like peptidoglycan-associated protein